MLSFLQEIVGRSPTRPERSMTRQDSIEAAFARVNARNASKDDSTTPSLTTGSSLADNSSEATESVGKKDNNDRSLTHSQAGTGSYKENILFGGSGICSTSNPGGESKHRTISGETLVGGGDNGSRERLLQQSVQALDEDWAIGAMPGDDLDISKKDEAGIQRRKSTRLDIAIERASSMVGKTTSVLGKRGREAVEAGKEQIQVLTGIKKRPRVKFGETDAVSPKKRARFSAASIMEISPCDTKSKPTSRKPSKHWIKQGLYVGQLPDFNPKLTETKNKLKKASIKQPQAQKPSAMPLPIFAGERTLKTGRNFVLPFDVFSPLPPGQPKPDEWKKTHKSMFCHVASSRLY